MSVKFTEMLRACLKTRNQTETQSHKGKHLRNAYDAVIRAYILAAEMEEDLNISGNERYFTQDNPLLAHMMKGLIGSRNSSGQITALQNIFDEGVKDTDAAIDYTAHKIMLERKLREAPKIHARIEKEMIPKLEALCKTSGADYTSARKISEELDTYRKHYEEATRISSRSPSK